MNRYLLLLLILGSSGITCNKAPSNSTGTVQVRISAPEVWLIGNAEQKVEGTFVAYFSDKPMLVVNALCSFTPDPSHKPYAKKIACHAYENGYLRRAKRMLSLDSDEIANAIGVALINKTVVGPGQFNVGHKYRFEVDSLGVYRYEGDWVSDTGLKIVISRCRRGYSMVLLKGDGKAYEPVVALITFSGSDNEIGMMMNQVQYEASYRMLGVDKMEIMVDDEKLRKLFEGRKTLFTREE